MELSTDDRGQASDGVMLVVTVTVVVLLGAFLLPVALDSFNEPTNQTYNQSVNTDYEIDGDLTSNVTKVTDGKSATVELTSGTEVYSNNVSVGSTTTYSFDSGDVNVTVDEAGSDYAVVNYVYPNAFSYSDGARSLWGIMDIVIVLGLFLLVIGLALTAHNKI